MEGGDESAAAFEAALGLNPRHFIDGVLDMVDDIGRDAFQFTRQEAATPGVLGPATADEKAAELERGLNAFRHAVFDILDKRMTSWEKYCLRNIFSLPKGFVLPEDDNSCAKEWQEDGTSDSDLLDQELDLLRKNLESANKESEYLRREMSSLERETTYKRELDSSIAEIQKLFEEKSVQQNFEELAKAIPVLQHKITSLNQKRTVSGSFVDQEVLNMNGIRTSKRLALDKDFTARTEDVQEIVNILQNK